MRELIDKQSGLVFFIPQVEKIELGSQVYSENDDYLVTQFQKEINHAQSPEITKYILGDLFIGGLGEFVKEVSDLPHYNQCYVFESGRLVATLVYSDHRDLFCKVDMFEYLARGIDKSKKNSKIANGKNYLSFKSIRRALNNNTEANNTIIEYFVVLPQYQNRGIGTRIISAINRNPQFFGECMNTFSTCIDAKNIPSQKVFNRNGYGLIEKSPQYRLQEYVKVL